MRFMLGIGAAAIAGAFIAWSVMDQEGLKEKADEVVETAKKKGINMLKVAVKWVCDHVTEVTAITTLAAGIEQLWSLKKAVVDRPEEKIIQQLDYISKEVRDLNMRVPTNYAAMYEGGTK